MSFYVGPGVPRLQADTWDAVVSAAGAGVLDETAWVELKEAVPASSAGANLELARDLASLSVDGGVLIIGVTDKGKEVVGTEDAHALCDRIIQVAQGRIYPPLYVDTTVIRTPETEGGRAPRQDHEGSGSTRAVVVVSVPASASAPHMVDERYWGRTSNGKRALSDAEVERLIAQRRQRADSLPADVRALSDLDPIAESAREHGHLYVLFRPVGYVGQTLSDALDQRRPAQLILDSMRGFSPRWGSLSVLPGYNLSHPDGFFLSAAAPGDEQEEDLFRVLLQDDGSVAAISGAGTRSYGREADAPEVVSATEIVGLVHGLAMIAGYIGTEVLGYWGQWEAGAFLDRLDGVPPVELHSAMSRYRYHPYQLREYFRATGSTSQEMSERPAAVVERLIGPFLRGLGVDNIYLPYEDPNMLYRI